ncbi:hypothetical protein R5W24_003354 [Gemmata sp. JC717]|uniref:hypothetical protein n=1 Tax=Gemmata algarum TaxID=2975278 RepID=UPI0021BB76FF|nr:hypothetical protein [Gemmata algarum]MDY3554235.1 hypothetical protein [Gemmata algarum]
MPKPKKLPQAQESLPPHELEARYGRVCNTRELAQEFTITGVIAPHVIVRWKADDVVGQMTFQNNPAYYHSFVPSDLLPETA